MKLGEDLNGSFGRSHLMSFFRILVIGRLLGDMIEWFICGTKFAKRASDL